MQKLRKGFVIAGFAALVLGLVFFGWQYLSLKRQLQEAHKVIAGQQVNGKVLAFSKMFVADVLRGGQTITFEQRLQLENAVRDINDPEIYAAWQKFTGAKEQLDIQNNFYNLFSLLLDKISAK